MSFTFSHPAVAALFRRVPARYYSVTGLVTGSMVPDFEYFLRVEMHSRWSHTAGGIGFFDLPLALVLAFIFHLVVRNPLIDHLPSFLRRKFTGCRSFQWVNHFKGHWFVVMAWILIGTCTHILWDSFTHEGGWFVTRLPFLQHTFTVSGFTFGCFKVMQHLGTLTGTIVILVLIYRLPDHPARPVCRTLYGYWTVVVAVTLTLVFIKSSTAADFLPYGQVIVTAISGGLLSLVIAGFLYASWRKLLSARIPYR